MGPNTITRVLKKWKVEADKLEEVAEMQAEVRVVQAQVEQSGC